MGGQGSKHHGDGIEKDPDRADRSAVDHACPSTGGSCTMTRRMPTEHGVGQPVGIRRRSYARPPVTERVLEVHVLPGPTPISTARDALSARWPDFPRVEEQTGGVVQFRWEHGRAQTFQEPTTR